MTAASGELLYGGFALAGRLVLDNNSISKILRFQVFYIFFLRFFVDILHFPSTISYGIDLLNLTITVFFLYSKISKRKIFNAGLTGVAVSVVILMIFVIFDGIINLVKPQLILWAFRNTMRYYPFFFSIVVFWDENRLESMLRFLLELQFPNFIIILFQFFVLNYHQDNIGGIFGCATGCNGALNVYLCIVTALSIEKFIHKKTNLISVLFSVSVFLVASVLAELKIGFFELPLIIILAILLNQPSFRMIVILIAVTLMIPIGVSMIVELFPQWGKSFVDINTFLEMGAGTGGGYNISRLGAFSDINRLVFQNEFFKKFWGLGFGNCEYSSIELFSSSFYNRYGWLHYRWFSHQMWFLECGYLGILLYAFFFIQLFVWITGQKRKFGDDNGLGSFGQITIILSIVNFIYNFTLRSEEGYMLYFALALTCLYYRRVGEHTCEVKEKTEYYFNS